jgi:HSP20 family protein
MNLMRRRKEEADSRLAPLSRLREEINRFFDSPISQWPRATAELLEGWGPSLDLYEDKDTVTVNAELPGLNREDIDVSVHGNTLSISGERKREESKGSGENYRSERYFGRFSRSITLPAAVDASTVTARYRDGVLTVTLPKTEEAKRKQIDVKVD